VAPPASVALLPSATSTTVPALTTPSDPSPFIVI